MYEYVIPSSFALNESLLIVEDGVPTNAKNVSIKKLDAAYDKYLKAKKRVGYYLFVCPVTIVERVEDKTKQQ